MGKFGDSLDLLLKRGNVEKKIQTLLPAQRKLLMWKPDENRKSILCWGGTRSGKTVGAMLFLAMVMHSIPGYTVALMATTEGQADITLGDTLKQMLQDLAMPYTIQNKYNHRCIVLNNNGSTAMIAGYQGRGVDNLLMGAPLDCAVIDEARHLKIEQYGKIYSRLSGCCQYNNVQMMILLTNPEGQEDWLFQHFIESGKGQHLLFPPADNEKNLPKGYFSAMRNELPEFMQKRLIDSVWCSAEGSIFRDMEKDKIFIEPVDPKQSVCMFQAGGLDFGFNHYFAFVLYEVHHTGVLIIKDTFFTKNTVLDIYAREIELIIDLNAKYYGNRVIGIYTDHEPEKQKMLNRIVNARKLKAVLKNANKAVKGDACLFLIRLMKTNKLKMYKTEGNRKLFQQMQIAVWDKNGKDMPMKKEGIVDDGLDALIYGVSRAYNNYKINRILGFDRVLSINKPDDAEILPEDTGIEDEASFDWENDFMKEEEII